MCDYNACIHACTDCPRRNYQALKMSFTPYCACPTVFHSLTALSQLLQMTVNYVQQTI